MPAQRIAPELDGTFIAGSGEASSDHPPTPKNIGGEITHWVIVESGWASDLFDEGSVERGWMELKPASGGVPIKCQR